MDKAVTSSPHDLAQRLYDKNIELENRRRKSAQARVPSDPNAWQQMRENFETIILEDHSFSEKHSIEFALWQLHYRRIEEFRAHYSAASASVSTAPQTRGGPARPDRASKIRVQFKTFLSEATGFYHDLILKIRAKYGLPIGQFYPEQENHKDEKKSMEIKKGLISCHRCLIYLGDLARYKGLYGEGESKSRDYAAASSYYLQAASLWPSSGNPHHQLAILATYSGDELMAVYRYFRSLAAEHPFSTARDNLIVAFEKNRQSYTQTHVDSNGAVKESPVRAKGRGREKADLAAQSKELITDADVDKATAIRQMFKAFRVRFVRLNGILFTHTSLETFEEILPLVANTLNELLSSGPEEERSFGTDADENGLFIVVLVSILIFTVNNVKGGTEGQSYADIVQNTVLLKNALITFYEITGQLLKRCIQLADPCSSFLLPGVLVCMEWIACHSDVISNDSDEKRSTAQIKFWSYCVSLFNKLLSAGLVSYDDDEDTSCFTDTRRYEEGVNEYQPALWEDFELRGFLPLEPAHAFLDFSRKHSDGKKDKLARVKRILSAGKVVADKITIDHKKVRFDSKLNKFVIGFDNQKDATGSKSFGGIKEMSSNTPAAAMMVKQSKVESHAEVEEDDEVIVFRPNLTDNRTEVISLKESQQEGFENVQNKDVGSFQNTVPQVPLPQSVLPVNSYTHSIGQPINNSYSQSTGQAGQPVKTNYTQSTGQPVVDSYTQSIGQAGQAVNSNYIQTIGQAAQPVNSSYTQSSGQAVQPVIGSYTQNSGQAGQPVNSSYTEGSGQAGQAVNSGYAQSIGHVGQLVNNSYTQSIGQAGQPVNSSYIQSIGQVGQPVSSSYIQSIGQAGQPTNNSYIQSIGQAGQPANNSYAQSVGQSYQFQPPMWSGNRQAMGSVAGGFQGLSLLENGHLGQPELQRDIRVSNATGFREGGVMYTGPTSSLKVSTNRPIRHLGPPPGFSSVRPKQVNELSSALGQNPLNDDYSWLDGYQLQSSMKGGAQPVNLQTNLSSQYMSGSVATSSFPFPGKQVPTVRFEGDKQKNSESSHTHHELLEQQFIPQMDQQGQPVWKGNHFV